MKFPDVSGMPFEVVEIANYYKLFSMGLTWECIQNMPHDVIDNLLVLDSKIKEKEEQELERSKNKAKR